MLRDPDRIEKTKYRTAVPLGEPIARGGSQSSGVAVLPPKVSSLDQDWSPTPQTLADPQLQRVSLGSYQATTSQADARQQLQVEIPRQNKSSDNAQTPDSELSFAEVAGSSPSRPRGPIQVKNTAPRSNSGSSGPNQVKPGNAVKKTWPYFQEALVVGRLGNTPSSKLPFRSFMWNLLETNGLGKPAHARSTLAGGLVMFFSAIQSLNALEEAQGRDDFRERISVRRSCGNSRKPLIKIDDMEDIDSEVKRNKIAREIEAECSLPNGTLRFVFKYSRDSKEQRSDWVLEVDPRYWVNICERHFRKEDILYEVEYFCHKSGRLLKSPLPYPRLKKDTLPEILQECPAYLQPTTSAARESPDKKRRRLEESRIKKAMDDSEKAQQEHMKETTFSTLRELDMCLKKQMTFGQYVLRKIIF
ncbi:hypothetical protein JTE90_020171 [Oedothorax gibbosus]|uniref:Uncharacterized protein n=1 Tax=Oedothorax gibbosus TaxID=931172 RepID=A0AAV6TYD0_9ARAC|nr:hypothetical protein JTE90_020171 [Oedothorax gibbosus]